MDLALNNLRRLMCHKINQPANKPPFFITEFLGSFGAQASGCLSINVLSRLITT